MYIYLVVIVAVVAVGFFIFLMSSALQPIQEAFNPMLTETHWSDSEHFDMFTLAAQFVTNLWLFFPALLIFGLIYYGYVYSQRRGEA